MPATAIRGGQIKDGSIQRVDVDVTTPGQSLIRKALQGAGMALTSDGADSGTGDVTMALDQTGSNPVTTFYIGSRMRLVAMATGGKIETMDGSNNWHTRVEWTEAT